MYDIIVVGGGISALSAGMYAGRLRLRTAVIGEDIGGTLLLTKSIQNWPGELDIETFELMDKLEEHAKSYGVKILEEKVIGIISEENLFKVITEERAEICKGVIIATGTKRRKFKAKAYKKFENKNIHYCAFCDGPQYKGTDIALIGGGDGALTEAKVLSKYAKKLYFVYRGDILHGEPVNLDQFKNLDNVELIQNRSVVSFEGGGYGEAVENLKGIKLDKPYNGRDFIEVNGVFVAIGGTPNSNLAEKLGVKVNESGELIVTKDMETNIPGVFGAGDVIEADFKQAIIASAQGVIAAYSAFKYVTENVKQFCVQSDFEIPEIINVEGVKDIIQKEGTLIIDVREKEEYNRGHIPGAVFSEIGELNGSKLNSLLDNAERIIVYSKDFDCPASTIASKKLIEMGYCNTYDFKGSFKEWIDRDFEYESGE